MKRKSSSKAFLGLAVVAAAAISCGGGSGGGSAGSSSGTGSATVSGNLSNQSMAMHAERSPTLLARIAHFLSPVTDAFAAPSGIQVLIHALETFTNGTGSFVISGVGSGTQTVTFSDGTHSFTLQIPVPDGSTVVLRDVDLNSNGTATPGEIDTNFRGTIGSASCTTTPMTLTIALTNENVTVDIDANTRIKGDAAHPAHTCADLAGLTGQPVRVEAETQSDGSFLAERVKVASAANETGSDIGFRGVVSATTCPTSLTVLRGDTESMTVNLTSSTKFEGEGEGEDDAALTCADLQNDEHVKVLGVLQTDGSVTANVIEVSTGGEEGCEGRRHFDFNFGEGEGERTPTPIGTTTPTPTATPSA